MKSFIKKRLLESINKTEYQIRYIDGPIFYKKTSDKWCFITAEEFAENVSKDNIVKWDNKT